MCGRCLRLSAHNYNCVLLTLASRHTKCFCYLPLDTFTHDIREFCTCLVSDFDLFSVVYSRYFFIIFFYNIYFFLCLRVVLYTWERNVVLPKFCLFYYAVLFFHSLCAFLSVKHCGCPVWDMTCLSWRCFDPHPPPPLSPTPTPPPFCLFFSVAAFDIGSITFSLPVECYVLMLMTMIETLTFRCMQWRVSSRCLQWRFSSQCTQSRHIT